MIKNNFIKEIVVSVGLIVVTILLLNPFEFWMPDIVVKCILVVTLAFFASLVMFVMREGIKDERDAEHRMFAGRAAFLTGGAVLTLGIMLQSLAHQVDPWLVYALVTMVVAKFVALIYSEKRR